VPEIRRQVVDMALNGSGIRETARVRPKRAAEVDEMWSFVGAKATERWL